MVHKYNMNDIALKYYLVLFMKHKEDYKIN